MSIMILSPGLKSFQRLEELRVLCRLGVDAIIMRTGGLLDVSHVTYRDWLAYLKKIEIQAAEGHIIIAKSSPTYPVALKMEIVATILQDAYDSRILPVDRSYSGVHERHLKVMRMLKGKLVEILKNAKHLERLDDDRAKKIREKYGDSQSERHAHI